MRRLSAARRAILAGLTAVLSAAVWAVPANGGVGASTVTGTIVGEGGDAMTPVMLKLMADDTAGLGPDTASYTNVDLDQAIADFVGTAPGSFANDFAVTERPLTSAEAATAKADGRSYAYVPFIATPVALMTLVPSPSYKGSASILPSQYCQHIPLTLAQLDGIYGSVTPEYTNWSDSRLSCTTGATTTADAVPFGLWGNLDPTMENYALMSLLDSTPTSQAAFGAGLAAAQSGGKAATSDPTPTESWPYSGDAVAGGDEATLGKIVDLDPRTSQPGTTASLIQLGAIMAIANVWMGDPLGVTWDYPTAAVQNAAGQFVAPSTAAAQAAENDATFATTTDPTTDNLVTFNASASDAAAYNNYLMLESYLLVPTNGLPADKALALAQFIRFAVGGKGQADIEALGAAPATPAMVTADLAVAQELDVEAASATTTASTTTTTAATTSTTSATSAASAGVTSSGDTGTSASTAGSTSGGGLAFTGGDPVPFLVLGFTFFICGELARQFLRRRRSRL